jgi:hypothetical protein
MRWLFRPTNLVLVSGALALVAAGLVFFSFGERAAANRAVPRPVPAGDQEVVFLTGATTAGWERFVASVLRLKADRPDLGLAIIDANAFPSQTTAVPELAVAARGVRARLWFRWYKLTADIDTGQWVQALARRDPPPLAIIGGGSSDRARDLARELNQLPTPPAPPLLFLTTATAVQVMIDHESHETRELMTLYPDRSFRFCFTNRQMAEAVIDFLWQQEDLRPDGEPVYLPHWEDDPYSEDLFVRFREVIHEVFQRDRAVRAAAQDWAWLAGRAALGGPPPGVDLERLHRPEDMGPRPFWDAEIPYSVGTFDRPNLWEAQVAELLLNASGQHPDQRRPLLILPAVPQPARRFLRGLEQLAPAQAGRFVVATGDGIDFNTVYRDRKLLWPIQDLPFPLVFFCHRNPVDPDAFRPESPQTEYAVPDPAGPTSTGTVDLLLYRDIVEAVVEAAYRDGRLLQEPDGLRQNLREPGPGDRRAFDELGNQRSGAGEYVVHLRPERDGDRIMPRASLEVWNRVAEAGGGRRWVQVQVAGQARLEVGYAPPEPLP